MVFSIQTPHCRSLSLPTLALLALLAYALGLAPINASAQKAGAIPGATMQLIVSTSDSWDSHRGQMRVFQRTSSRGVWKQVLFERPVPVLFGKRGMAWGRGALAIPAGATRSTFKREGDRRTPAGCFRLGRVFGYAPGLPGNSAYPYKQVTKWDAWVDDVKHPLYNQHYLADPNRGIPPWFEKARMRLGDSAYAWKLEVRHNSDPPAPGAGSAIFFHIRRGENRASSGCTTMEEDNLLSVLQWLRAEANPHYVALPIVEYTRLQKIWKLPILP